MGRTVDVVIALGLWERSEIVRLVFLSPLLFFSNAPLVFYLPPSILFFIRLFIHSRVKGMQTDDRWSCNKAPVIVYWNMFCFLGANPISFSSRKMWGGGLERDPFTGFLRLWFSRFCFRILPLLEGRNFSQAGLWIWSSVLFSSVFAPLSATTRWVVSWELVG